MIFRPISYAWHQLFGTKSPASVAADPDGPMAFAGGSAAISAFTDPAQLSPEMAARLSEALGIRPDPVRVSVAEDTPLSTQWRDMVTGPKATGGRSV